MCGRGGCGAIADCACLGASSGDCGGMLDCADLDAGCGDWGGSDGCGGEVDAGRARGLDSRRGPGTSRVVLDGQARTGSMGEAEGCRVWDGDGCHCTGVLCAAFNTTTMA